MSEVLTKKDYNKVSTIIAFMEKHGEITPKEAETITKKSAATVRRYFKMLVDTRYIVQREAPTTQFTVCLQICQIIFKYGLFVPEEKKKILSKLEVTALEMETAKVISKLAFEIGRAYTDAALNVLGEKDKCVLLLNQIESYENEELSDLFAELDQVYHQLIERTPHMFKFAYTDYNKELLDKLVQKDYITRAEEEWMDKEGHTASNKEKEHVIVGYVKQFKA